MQKTKKKTGNLGREITDLIGIYQNSVGGKDVTGRDNQIISEALKLAIPMMIKHSLSASNTEDMIQILDQKFHDYLSIPLENSINDVLNQIIYDILKSDLNASHKNNDYMKTPRNKFFTLGYVKKLKRQLSGQ